MRDITGKIKRAGLTAALVAVVGMSLVACGGDAATATPPAQPTASTAAATGGTTAVADTGVQEIKISLKEWAIEPANVEVNAGKVKFIVTNDGQFAHNATFMLDGQGGTTKTKNFKSDENPQTLEVVLKPGTYTMICDITGHADRGMKGTLTVK